jgi:hypothetical protein
MMGQWGPKHVAVYVYWNIIVLLTKCAHLLVYIVTVDLYYFSLCVTVYNYFFKLQTMFIYLLTFSLLHCNLGFIKKENTNIANYK